MTDDGAGIGLRVLVVEDSEHMRGLLSVLLREAGHEVALAAHGAEGLEVARSTPPDVVLLDLVMPGLHGLEVLDRFSSDPELARIPVIVVTGVDAGGEAVRALQRGAHDYITKPFEPAELVARVGAAGRAKQRADELQAAASRFRGEAMRDPLTGLGNRRLGEEELRRMIFAAARDRTPLALVKLDVDRFKAINDTCGHDAGDRALRAVAERLRARTRSTDVVVRWGGDEFVVLAATHGDGARRAASEVQHALRGAGARIGAGWTGPVTVSVGIAEWRGGPGEELLQRADRALYAAKRAGRDRIVVDAGNDHELVPNHG